MTTELKWAEGKPKEVGLYFVAVQYGEAAGSFDFVNWDGGNWDSEQAESIIAFLSLQDFKNQLNIKWPAEETIQYIGEKLSENDDDLWSEA
jgi:hypothetical protein